MDRIQGIKNHCSLPSSEASEINLLVKGQVLVHVLVTSGAQCAGLM